MMYPYRTVYELDNVAELGAYGPFTLDRGSPNTYEWKLGGLLRIFGALDADLN